MGMTFVLHMLGKQPVEKDLFMSPERRIKILSEVKNFCWYTVWPHTFTTF